jgi:hypothetical protein
VVEHATRIALILATAWMVAAVAVFLLDLNLGRHRIDVPDNRDARRLRTQVLIRRLIQSLVVVIAVGATLTFPAVQAVGTSLLASTGVLSVVAGLAAQSTLANLFAGLQIAFSDALRIDDAVMVENEWRRVEEITLTYVCPDPTAGSSCPRRTSPRPRSRTGRAGPPSCSVPSSWTSTGVSTPHACGRSWNGCWPRRSCGAVA